MCIVGRRHVSTVRNDDRDGRAKPLDEVRNIGQTRLLPYDLYDGARLPMR
jgi:hypothetical protein